ncbi:reverse transcriptase domain-containing protein, partial [Tanacetum coccineum]
MSNSDELRRIDNTTLVPPRLPDTLPQVYHRRRPTLGLHILPSVPSFSPTIRRTARISIFPIEPNLAERARISAINLNDYQLDPLTPPPSPSSLFSMAAYQRMIAKTDPTQREEALTTYRTEIGHGPLPKCLFGGVRSLHDTVGCEALINRSTNRNNVDINSGIDTQMLNQLIATRVAEALAAAAVTHAVSTQEENNLGSNSAQNKACNYKEFHAVMHENFHGSEGTVGLTRWFEKLESQFGISNVAEGDRGDFKVMFIRKYCPRNEVKQMENELWNLKVKGTNLTTYNQHFQELILSCPEMVPNTDRLLEHYIKGLPLSIKGNVTSSKPVDLHEAIDMAQGLMYQVVQELGENSGDKRKWNENHYNHNPNNTNNTRNLNPNKRPKTARVFSAGQGSYAGKLPYCGKCGRDHTNVCSPTCHNCGRAGHKAKDCRAPPRLGNQRGPGSQGGQGSDVTCFECGEKGHYKNKCPNSGSQGGGNQIRGNQQNPQNNLQQDELCLCKCGQGLCHAFKNQKGVTHICPQIGEKNCGFRQFIGTTVLKARSSPVPTRSSPVPARSSPVPARSSPVPKIAEASCSSPGSSRGL